MVALAKIASMQQIQFTATRISAWLLTFVICLVSVNAPGQKNLDFDKLGFNDGFTSSKANAILQDRKGFIWIGTWNGLNRYDGYNVEIFRPGYHDTTTISNREVLALLEDHEGNIWAGTTSGLNKYDPVTRKWKTYPFQHRIISLFEDRDHIIWVGTWNGGMYRLDTATGEILHFLENEIISDIYEDSRNILWAATYYGLIYFDRNTSGYKRYIPDGETPSSSISSSIVTQIAESDDGKLWVGTWGGGLNRIEVHPDSDSLKFLHYTSRDDGNSLSSDVIYRLHYDQYNNLWIGSWDAGLSLLASDQQDAAPGEAQFENHSYDLRNPDGISGNNVSAIWVDRAGMLWVGSAMIDRTNILNTGITRHTPTISVGGYYLESPVRSLSNRDEQLWVGTTHDLRLYRSHNGHFAFERDYPKPEYDHGSIHYVSNSVLALLQDDDGLWVGTEDAGLIHYPGKQGSENLSGAFRFYNTLTEQALPGNKVGMLVRSEIYPGVIWAGTLQNGFVRIDRQNGSIAMRSYTAGNAADQLSDNSVRALVEDREGKVWIGTQNGLNCFDPETEKFTRYYYALGDTNTINDNVINVLHEDAEGNLWIGSNAGLNKKRTMVTESDSLVVYFSGFPGVENISDEIITNILEDDSGNLWVGVYRGMVRLSKAGHARTKEYFSREYQQIIVERNTAIRGEDGLFLFGGSGGFISFHPDSLLRDVVPPEVCITDLLVSNNSLYAGMPEIKKQPVFRSVPYLDDLRLSHRAKVLTFEFSAMDFKEPRRNAYAYMLEGLETTWNEVGSRNTATYTNLRPGDYTFRVSAVNSDGIESIAPAEFTFTIATPWYQSVVAMFFYFAVLIGLLYFFKEYSIIGVREKGRIMIEHMHYEKEHEVNEMKSLFFTNITHEFRTPLTLILGPAEELLKSAEIKGYARRQAELIEKNAHRLLRLVNQLMEFRKVETGNMELQRRKTNIVILLNELYDSFKGMAASRNIDFTITLSTRTIEAYVDHEKLEKALYNLLSNAFKYSEDHNTISIHAEIDAENYDERMCVVEIEDTGIGIPEAFQDKIFERFFQINQKITQSTGGIGLYVTKTFVEQHGGTIELESAPGQGSCFRVILPVDRKPETLYDAAGEAGPEMEQQEVHHDPAGNGSDSDLHDSNEFRKVLVVEDDHELNEFIVNGLSEEFNVIGAKNGKEALEIARKDTPDIIITDIMMPEMDGIELTRLLRADRLTSHIPVVFLTAKTMQEDEIDGLKIGAVDYIFKPFNLINLQLKVQNVLDNRRRIHERIRTERLTDPGHIELTSLDEKFLRDAVQSVNDHLDDTTFDVEKFSYALGMSPNQAYRKIKVLTGQTANEFIRNQRLKTAADMLLQKRRSISEIIYMVGFSSPSYFTRCFKQYYGCTPKEYIDRKGEV